MKKIINEFKEFISKGNVVDLAVGVVIGSAFSKIVSSLVDDIIMPIVGVIIGGIDFSNLSIKFRSASINYGMFIQNVIDFLIVAFCIFIVVKFMNRIEEMAKKRIKKEEEKQEEAKPVESDEVKLLKEINNNLKKLNKNK